MHMYIYTSILYCLFLKFIDDIALSLATIHGYKLVLSTIKR